MRDESDKQTDGLLPGHYEASNPPTADKAYNSGEIGARGINYQTNPILCKPAWKIGGNEAN